MTTAELIKQLKADIKECEEAEKSSARKGHYFDAIHRIGMVDAYKRILWTIKKLQQ